MGRTWHGGLLFQSEDNAQVAAMRFSYWPGRPTFYSTKNPRLGSPREGVKMFDENLVHAPIGGKDLDGGSAELSVNPGLTIGVLTRGHGSLLLDL